MNRESERKRLVELLKHECDVDGRYDGEGNCPGCKYNGMEDCSLQELADHLLNNGIVVPPVKVDSKIYTITSGLVLEYEVFEIRFDSDTMWFWSYNEEYEKDHFEKFIFTKNDIGKTVFTSREEAEKMLKGSKNNG